MDLDFDQHVLTETGEVNSTFCRDLRKDISSALGIDDFERIRLVEPLERGSIIVVFAVVGGSIFLASFASVYRHYLVPLLLPRGLPGEILQVNAGDRVKVDYKNRSVLLGGQLAVYS